jgi:hypothetical protein
MSDERKQSTPEVSSLRRAYRSPTFGRVSLVAEEVLSTGCKSTTMAGYGNNPCVSIGWDTCLEPGS